MSPDKHVSKIADQLYFPNESHLSPMVMNWLSRNQASTPVERCLGLCSKIMASRALGERHQRANIIGLMMLALAADGAR